MITIYHNPRCSKSREAFAIAEHHASERKIDLHVVEYLQQPPSYEELVKLQQLIGCDVGEMVRTGEDEYAQLNLAGADETTLLQAIAAHPKLLQRPIIVYGDQAIIARPPERLEDLLSDAE